MTALQLRSITKYAKYLSRMVLINFGQQWKLFEVNACVFI